jgi:hypothetical protein
MELEERTVGDLFRVDWCVFVDLLLAEKASTNPHELTRMSSREKLLIQMIN